MGQPPPKKTSFWRSLTERFHAPADDSQDLLLKQDVERALAQLSTFVQPGHPEERLAAGASALAASQAAFGFRLFHLLTGQIQQNVFFSPVSLFLALCMIYNGAEGQTKEILSQVLNVDEEDCRRVIEALLVNVLYFHGKWAEPFEPRDTAPGLFISTPARYL